MSAERERWERVAEDVAMGHSFDDNYLHHRVFHPERVIKAIADAIEKAVAEKQAEIERLKEANTHLMAQLNSQWTAWETNPQQQVSKTP